MTDRIGYVKSGLVTAALSVMLVASVSAQDRQNRPQGERPEGRPERPNFDPEQMRQRFMENIRERLEVKDDAEWKLVSTRLEKVMEARRGGGPGGGFGFFGGPGGPPRNDGERSSGRPSGADSERQGRGGFGGRFGQEDPASAELRAAIEAKASSEELKRKVAAVKAAREKREQDLRKAQEELKQVLSVRQEAIATSMGFL